MKSKSQPPCQIEARPRQARRRTGRHLPLACRPSPPPLDPCASAGALFPLPVFCLLLIVTPRGGCFLSCPRHRSRFLFDPHCEKVHEVGSRVAAMDFTLQTYYPIFLYFLAILAFAVGTLVMAH